MHTTYRLSSDQEEVYLTSPTGVVVDAVHYVNMPTDVAYARVPNGVGHMRYQSHTYEANNQPISQLSEINYESNFRLSKSFKH